MTEANDESGVGLSDASLSRGRREMLDLVNRLHSTGYVDLDVICRTSLADQSQSSS
jgi:hypothetical protein